MTCIDEWAPRAFGGGVLKGDNVTKFVHMDEAGISRDEPYCIQAGVIVDADKQWRKVQSRLIELVLELVPREFWPGYVFHAKDVFHGTDPAFSRERMPNPEDRAAVVQKVAHVAREFSLPVALGVVDRSKLTPEIYEDGDARSIAARIHAVAYGLCVHEVERWMRDSTGPDEVAMLFVEDNTDTRAVLRLLHHSMKTPNLDRPAFLERVIENPSFCGKEPASILQIADAYAFSAARCIRRATGWETLYDGIRDSITFWPPSWGEQSS